MLTRRRVVAAKVEVTEGTAISLSSSDGGILALKPKVTVDIKMFPRKNVLASLSQLAEIPAGQSAKIAFSAEAKGPGSAYSSSVLPALDKYIRACGFAATVVTTSGSETVTYAPASTGIPSLTIACYEDGVIKTICGARGNLKMAAKANEPIMFDFEFEGVLSSIIDGALLAPSYEGTVPPPFINAAFSIASFTPVLQSFDIDMKNKLALREDVTLAAGYRSALITERNAGGKFDPEMNTVATYDWYGKWNSGTSGALVIGPVGATQYNKVTINANKVLARKIGEADRNGIAATDFEFQLAMTSGDDEISIVFS